MKRFLSIIIAIVTAGALIASAAALGGTVNQAPPVAQPLVREGEFALKLAAELDLGTPTEEAAAEDVLAKAGIAPANGWLSDYPVTPQIIGELSDSLSQAAGAGRISMTREQALKGFSTLTAQYNLPVPAETATTAPGSQTPATAPVPSNEAYQPNPAVVNNYYYDEGPPVVTYYPPPPDYYYLYDYVPYPVVWFGFWWPGFYVCHDFSTVVVVRDRPAVVSNHVVIASTGAVAIVDPVGRHGPHRPVPVLRTSGGTVFRTVADFRAGIGGTAARLPGTAIRGEGERTSIGFRSITARTSAANIYSRSIMNNNAGVGRSTVSRSFSNQQRSYSTPASPTDKTYNMQGPGSMSYREQRSSGSTRPESSVGRENAIPKEQRATSLVTPFWRGTERPVFQNGQLRPFSGGERSITRNYGDRERFFFPGIGSIGGETRKSYSSSGYSGGSKSNGMNSGRSSGGFCRGTC